MIARATVADGGAPGADRSAGLRQKLAVMAARAPVSRGARFARATAQKLGAGGTLHSADFATLAAMPAWAALPTPEQNRTALVAALLELRPSIDRELSGSRLSALAALVGEDMFDAVCAHDIDPAVDQIEQADASPSTLAPTSAPTLPAPSKILALGQVILDSALPVTLRPTGAHDGANTAAEAIAGRAALADAATVLVIAGRAPAATAPDAPPPGANTDTAA